VAKSQDLPYPITLISAYAVAMGKVAADFPDDNEIALLYTEALMDLSPWNYWQPGGHEPSPQSAPIVPTLERVLAKDPNHPGAIHFYIHVVEASDRPQRAEPYAETLDIRKNRTLSLRHNRQARTPLRSGRRESMAPGR
jgi:hypothetical protein